MLKNFFMHNFNLILYNLTFFIISSYVNTPFKMVLLHGKIDICLKLVGFSFSKLRLLNHFGLMLFSPFLLSLGYLGALVLFKMSDFSVLNSIVILASVSYLVILMSGKVIGIFLLLLIDTLSL